MEPCAAEDPGLRTLFPHDAAKAWHDEHLGETVAVVWKFGPGALQGTVTAHVRQTLNVPVAQLHDDTTSVQVCGRYAVQDEAAAAAASGAEVPLGAPATARTPVRLGPGPSTDHRPAWNQVKGGWAVRADGGVPVVWEAQDGNQADGSPSVESGLKITALVGRTDFLCVGDGQLVTPHHLVALIQPQGRLLAPLPGSAGLQQPREEWVWTNPVEDLRPRREASGQARWDRGCCRPSRLGDAERRQYPGAVPLWCNPRWRAETQAHLERRLQKTPAFWEGLPTRLGKRHLQSQAALAPVLEATRRRSQTRDVLTYRLVETTTTRTRSRARGRPAAEAFDAEVSAVHWSVDWQWLPAAIEHANMLRGSFPVITHDPSLTTAPALDVYQEPYHPEQRFKWLQGAGSLAPVVLQKPHRLQAFCLVVGLVLQRLTVVEREAARRLAASGRPLIGLQPNRLPD
jgi:hypothetical protein